MLLLCKMGLGVWGTWASLLIGAVAASVAFAAYFARATAVAR
jgi:hypothetical protein